MNRKIPKPESLECVALIAQLHGIVSTFHTLYTSTYARFDAALDGDDELVPGAVREVMSDVASEISRQFEAIKIIGFPYDELVHQSAVAYLPNKVNVPEIDKVSVRHEHPSFDIARARIGTLRTTFEEYCEGFEQPFKELSRDTELDQLTFDDAAAESELDQLTFDDAADASELFLKALRNLGEDHPPLFSSSDRALIADALGLSKSAGINSQDSTSDVVR